MAQKIDAQQMMSFENTTFDPCGIMIPSPNLLLQQVSADCYAKSPGGPRCDFGQSLSVTLMASQVTNAIVTAVTNNSDYSNLISNVSASSNTHSSGPIEDVGNVLSGMIKAFMDAITGAGGMVAAAIAIVCICCCCFCIIAMIGGGAALVAPSGGGGATSGGGGAPSGGGGAKNAFHSGTAVPNAAILK